MWRFRFSGLESWQEKSGERWSRRWSVSQYDWNSSTNNGSYISVSVIISSLYSRYYVEACNGGDYLHGMIAIKKRRSGGKPLATLSGCTGSGIDPQTYRTDSDIVPYTPTYRCVSKCLRKLWLHFPQTFTYLMLTNHTEVVFLSSKILLTFFFSTSTSVFSECL